jgi:hypothetical protein
MFSKASCAISRELGQKKWINKKRQTKNRVDLVGSTGLFKFQNDKRGMEISTSLD